MIERDPPYIEIQPSSLTELGGAFAANTINTAIYRHHGIVTQDGLQYTAYYEDAETIQIVKRDLASGRIEQFPLKNTHPIKDAHNTISLGLDRDSHVHLAICTHAGRLQYRVSKAPRSIDQWSAETQMTGFKEEHLTYPTFIMSQNPAKRSLLFLYRSGFPEKGEACMKRYSEQRREWSDLKSSILSGTDNRPWSSGPYWNHPVWDRNGILHLSFIWRSAPLGPTKLLNNKGIDYARSEDAGENWLSTRGIPFNLPITQVNSETIFPVPSAANLMNQTSMAIDPDGNPHVVFYADDPNGIPQYQHLWWDGTRWKCKLISQRTEDFELSITLAGHGTMPLPISRPEIVISKTGVALVLFRADFTDQRLALLRLHPPDYNYDSGELRLLWREPVGFAEPVIDRMRWNEEEILTMLVQKNDQPLNEGASKPKFESIRIVDWAQLD